MSSFAATASLKVSPRRLFNSSTAARAIRYFASGSSSRMVDYRSSLFQLGNTSPDYQHRHGLQQLRNSRHYSPTSLICDSSPFSDNNNSDSQTLTRKKRKKKRFIPRKAAVQLTPKAREFFKKLLESDPTKKGILLDYHQASSGEPRMVFSFKFVNNTDDDDGGDGGTLTDDDEGVTLEVNEDGTPKTPAETWDDGKPKLYIHRNAFLKVLGATVDVNMDTITPVLTDKEGFEIDPSA